MIWEAVGAIGQAVSALALMIAIAQVRQVRHPLARDTVQARQ